MAHFAKLDENNIVIQVNSLVNQEIMDEEGNEVEAKGIEFLRLWSGGHTNWKQTSYNGTFRKNFAGIGFTYDSIRDAFIEPQPFPSWILNEDTCRWQSPIEYPNNGKEYTGKLYAWDEDVLNWVEIPD
jgi:hypothetical protein